MLCLSTQSSYPGVVHYLLKSQSSPPFTDFDYEKAGQLQTYTAKVSHATLKASGFMFLSKALCLVLPIKRSVTFKLFQ